MEYAGSLPKGEERDQALPGACSCRAFLLAGLQNVC